MSSHLGVLARARLIASRKDGRSVIYAVDLAGTRELLSFLLEDCCRGKPQLCASLIDSTLAECCPA
jgi:DNA-binding transcriptional ArsR family regulator